MTTEKIAVIGLGYVGWPLSLAFGKHFTTVGYDINPRRVADLQQGYDHTNQAQGATLADTPCLLITTEPDDMAEATVFVLTVPTPIDRYKKPDLRLLLAATQTIGQYLKRGDVVVFESTVYPGCTEEDCVPILEKTSGLRLNQDFFVGYSPERVSPGDPLHTLTTIVKVTSGSSPEAARFVNTLYQAIIPAGTHLAPSIRVAEAAKAIENAQRDLNISFMNELALIFDRMGIDTGEVLQAASTKWNFLKFKPGLVGGHCIGVDPYYLVHKAESLGYHPQVILSGRRINDQMGVFVASKLVKLMIKKGHTIAGARVLLLGITFKENCPDIRNSRVIDVYRELAEFGVSVDVFDPWANAEEVMYETDIQILNEPIGQYAGIVLAVAHEQFSAMTLAGFRTPETVVFDLKGIWPRHEVDARL
jgi:UDP-N-acetyl-D-glucosamine/UDP-N-acetyl-D-galactosamine dehydrogenase